MFFSFGSRPRFDDAWLPILRDNVLLSRTLSEAEHARLRDKVAALVTTRSWEGCAGQPITDEVRVTIAGQAALLLLGFDDYAFDEVRSILVYPGSFLARYEDDLGHPNQFQQLLGQAAADGPVILSWWHARWGGRRLAAVNVVLHEFAHTFAELGDPDRGRPPLLDAATRRRWDAVMGRAYDELIEDSDYGRPAVFDSYGAESPSEFFAVATEAFFLRPTSLRARHPDVYALLAACYRQDPAARPTPPEVAASAEGAEEEYSRQAVRECSAALAQYPDHLEALRERAAHRGLLGEFDEALADWSRLLERVEADERAEVRYERALAYQDAGRLDEALADLDAVLTREPGDVAARIARGLLHDRRGAREAALADLTAAVRADPRDDYARLARARVYLAAGQPDRALKDVDRAIAIYPHDPESQELRREILAALGREES